ncbi:MAG: CHAD domain-containing protein [Gammaproteobacteria bacterium]
MDRVLARFEDPASDPAENIHQLRTCCKRMRALLLLLPGDTRRLRRRFRDAARFVGALRDHHVGATHATRLGGGPPTARDTNDREATALEGAVSELRRGRADVTRWPTAGLCEATLGEGFERTLRRCDDALARALAEPSDERVHALRKWVKYHYYQLLALAPLGPPSLHERSLTMHEIGHLLGEAHDLAVLEADWPRRTAEQRRTLRNLQARKRRRKRRGLALAQEWLRERHCPVPGSGVK